MLCHHHHHRPCPPRPAPFLPRALTRLLSSETDPTTDTSFQIVYFGRCIPWLIIDEIPWFHQWKLQPTKKTTWAQIWKCTRVVLLTHFTCEAPLIWLFHPICCYFGMSTFEVPFSPLWLMACQIAFFFVFEDTFHYW